MKKKIKNVVTFICLIFVSIMIIGSIYYAIKYPYQDFDQILYYLLNGVENTAPSVINNIIFSCIIPVIVLSMILYKLTTIEPKNNTFLWLKIRNKQFKIKIYPINFIKKHRAIYVLIMFLIAIIIVIFGFKIDEYIINQLQDTKIYEDHYISAGDVEITFPEKKRNLILIIAESMETTVLSKENGGAWDYSIIPELEKIALDNTSFSNNENIGGAYQTYGTSFSAGGIVGITAGIPLITGNVMIDNEYKGTGEYLPGAYTLGEVLREQGYNLEVMMGSDATFGGRQYYFKTNGDYKIFDVNYAIEQGKMKMSDKVWWGFEDDKLFKWSKEEITNLASQEEPFSYIMITADTHFVDGYLSPNAEKKFGTQYENVHAYSSKSINEFVEWVKGQEFYENTTIVIVGDHLGMQTEFYEEKVYEGYERMVYNAIINSTTETENYKNRIFTTLDFYPTILSSIGAKIEGERLGLGTNLFSEVPTLSEELGYEYVNTELRKYSTFYNEKIMGKDYYMIKE